MAVGRGTVMVVKCSIASEFAINVHSLRSTKFSAEQCKPGKQKEGVKDFRAE